MDPHGITDKPTRVAVVGSSCSGKTTLARSMARLLDVPHIELDAIHWKPNWCERSAEEFRTLTKDAVAQEQWIADGNYSRARDIIWNRATVVIWLDYPFLMVFWRALCRTVIRVFRKEELFSGNRETFRQAFFSKDSLLWWIITDFHRRRREYRAVFDGGEFHHLALIELRKPTDANGLLRCIEEEVTGHKVT